MLKKGLNPTQPSDKKIVIRGVLLLQSGATPSVVEANLKAYLEPAKRGAIKTQTA